MLLESLLILIHSLLLIIAGWCHIKLLWKFIKIHWTEILGILVIHTMLWGYKKKIN